MSPAAGRLRTLTEEYQQLAQRLKQGGGAARVAKLHQQPELAPRERVERLLDRVLPGSSWDCWWRTINTKGRLPARG